MRTAIVILNWNGRALLEKFLPGVIDHSQHLASIYVADNASTDNSVAFVRKNFPTIHIIEMRENKGYAGGYNEALSKVEEDLLILMNSDIATTSGWLEPIRSAFLDQQDLGAAQPKILDYKQPEYFEYAGAAGGYIDAFGYPFCRGRIFNSIERDEGQYDNNAAIFWASGACLAVRKDVFWGTGALDEQFFAHQEEIDLCWRIHAYGYTIKCIADSKVYHVGGATLESSNPKKTYLNFRNSLFVLLKNLPSKRLIPVLFIRMLLDGVAALKFVLEGNLLHFISILKAHRDFYRYFSRVRKKRSSKKFGTYFATHSIVWSYFLLNIKSFTKI